jgi:hypothetical protein
VALSLLAVLTVGTVQPPSSAGSGVEVPATPGWHNAIDGTDRWDALWFERIARNGYNPQDASAAFFPGYPLSIRAIGSITSLSKLSSGLLVSNVAFLCALVVLFALTTRESSKNMARRTVLLVACFPASFFFLAPYSESLFLVMSLLAFWWARARRPWLAGLAGSLAALTRSVGVLLVPALLVEAWGQRGEGRRKAIVASLVPLLAPLSYFIYWQARAGDALQPLHAQDFWFRRLEFPLVTLGHALWLGIVGITDARGIYWTADLLLTALIIVPFVLRWGIVAPSYLVYVVATWAMIFSYPLPERPLLSDPRFLVVLFPAFWAMADLWTGTRFAIALSAFAVGFAALSIAFMNWGFVF